MKGLFNKLLGIGIKGAGLAGGFYLGFEEENWALGGICILGGYVLGSLFEILGFENYYEKRKNDFERLYLEKQRKLEESYTKKKDKLEEMRKKLEEIARKNSD